MIFFGLVMHVYTRATLSHTKYVAGIYFASYFAFSRAVEPHVGFNCASFSFAYEALDSSDKCGIRIETARKFY